MKRIFLIFIWLVCVSFGLFSDDKIIDVPKAMTIEVVVADQNGFLDGTYNMRVRLFIPSTSERLWYEDINNVEIDNGSFVITINSEGLLDEYELFNKNVQLVVTIEDDTFEVPLLTYLYSYRSLFAEFGWEIRFPDVLYIDRESNYVGVGTQAPKMFLDINGSIKLDYEITEVTGAVRWNTNTYEVKHPAGWVDLLYTPETFIASRWTDYGDLIELTSSNYKIGINRTTPVETLDVEGLVRFTGDLSIDSITANAIQINSLEISDTGVTMGFIELVDSSKTMFWTSENVYVNYGKIQGNGSGLTNIGALAKDFELQLLTTNHLDDDVVASRNITFQAIVSKNIRENELTMDRFIPNIFDSSYIEDNAIGSDNINAESISFDAFSDSISLSDYIPDDFFTSSLIASNSVYAVHIEEYSLTSENIKDDIFGADYFRDSIVIGVDFADDAITYEKLATDSIQLSLFTGILSMDRGGTGISSVSPRSILFTGETSIDVQNDLVFDSGSGFLGLLDSELSDKFSIYNDSGSANIRLQTPSGAVGLVLNNQSSSVKLQIDSNGYFNFNVGSQNLYLSDQGVFSYDSGLSQYQFNLNSGLTLANSHNDEPNDGTIEFDSSQTRFRFFNGTEWTNILMSGYGIGNPSSDNIANLVVTDSFIGSAFDTFGNLRSSAIDTMHSSHVNGEAMTLHHINRSRINGALINGGVISGATLNASNVQFDRVLNSDVNGNNLVIDLLKASEVFGNSISLANVHKSNIKGAHANLNNLSSVDGTLHYSQVINAKNSHLDLNQSKVENVNGVDLDIQESIVLNTKFSNINGKNHYLDRLIDTHVAGDTHYLMMVDDSDISGHGNRVTQSKGVFIHGNDNHVVGDLISVTGENNLLIGSNQQVVGDRNIVFSTGTESFQLDDHSVVAFNAENGVYFATAPGMLVGATEAAGGWQHVSDKELKTGFSEVDYSSVFNGVMDLSISKWEYSFRTGVQHIGPMAQDFWHAFKLGEDSHFITATDADGVAFSAIKYLISELDHLDNDVINNDFSLSEYFDILVKTEASLEKLESSLKMKNEALAVLVDSNLDQYIMMDKQFKVISRFKNVPTLKSLIIELSPLVFFFIFGILLGFLIIKMYYKYDSKKGNTHGI